MNIEVVKNAIGALDKLLSQAKSALWQVEREVFGDPGYGSEGGRYEYPRKAMAYYLEELHGILLVVLEAAQMSESRATLIKEWKGFTSAKDSLCKTYEDNESQICQSPALTFLERVLHGLRITVSDGRSSEEAWTLNRLELMLRDTSALVHRRGTNPTNELDLQEIMHDYLSACFPDFRKNPQIGGTIKRFVPDCGIASVGAAIEFKFVHRKEQVAVAFSGVAEDTAAYKGSKDWTCFYTVIYQAQPFMLESHLRSDLRRIGAVTWTGIVVNGPTTEKVKKRLKKSKVNKNGQAT